jgi:ABC-type multidrug transport system permease subunit
MLIGGLMVPLSMLPAGIQTVSALLPSTQAMQAIQGLAYGQPTVIPPLAALGALAGGALLSFGLATYLFNWDTRNASRRGHPALAILAWIPYALTILLV